eukprot:194250-Amphidinium_carterae.1
MQQVRMLLVRQDVAEHLQAGHTLNGANFLPHNWSITTQNCDGNFAERLTLYVFVVHFASHMTHGSTSDIQTFSNAWHCQ